jgi:hypothetical protein
MPSFSNTSFPPTPGSPLSLELSPRSLTSPVTFGTPASMTPSTVTLDIPSYKAELERKYVNLYLVPILQEVEVNPDAIAVNIANAIYQMYSSQVGFPGQTRIAGSNYLVEDVKDESKMEIVDRLLAGVQDRILQNMKNLIAEKTGVPSPQTATFQSASPLGSPRMGSPMSLGSVSSPRLGSPITPGAGYVTGSSLPTTPATPFTPAQAMTPNTMLFGSPVSQLSPSRVITSPNAERTVQGFFGGSPLPSPQSSSRSPSPTTTFGGYTIQGPLSPPGATMNPNGERTIQGFFA